MKILVNFIAPVSMKSTSEQLFVEIGPCSVQVAVKELVLKYGESIEKLIFDKDGKPYVMFLVNGNAVSLDHELQQGEILSILPPIAGG